MNEVSLSQENKTALAAALGILWADAHGTPAGSVHVLIGPDSLAVLIKDAFSPAEQAVAQRVDGQPIIQQYAEQLLTIVEPDLRAQVEVATGQRVTLASVHADTAGGHLLCFYNLGDRLESDAENQSRGGCHV
jgi:uncharacterized protein YbcI